MKKIVTGIAMILLSAMAASGHAEVREGAFSLTPLSAGIMDSIHDILFISTNRGG